MSQVNYNSLDSELRKLVILIKRNYDNFHRQYFSDLTRLQGEVLLIITHASSDVYQRDIEQKLCIRRSTATQLLSTMERKGLITRENVEQDARLKKLVVTDKSRALLDMMHKTAKEVGKKLIDGINANELQQFLEILHKMQDNMSHQIVFDTI